MKNNNYDDELHQGASFARNFTFLGDGPHGTHSLVGWDVRLHVRAHNADGPLVLECDIANERLIVLDALNGVLQWKLTPADTRGIKFPKGDDHINHLDCVYSLELKDPTGEVHVPVRAKLRVYRAITR